MAVRGLLVPARDLRPGDVLVLPNGATRVVKTVEESTFGMQLTPCIRVIYHVRGGASYENKATAHGLSSFPQTEGSLKPLAHDECVTLERRGPEPAEAA